MQKKIMIGVFIIWIFGMSLLSLLIPKRTFSEMENRYLAELPAAASVGCGYEHAVRLAGQRDLFG